MTYRGQVKNGVVVLEGGPALEEGTIVRVEPLDAAVTASAPRGSAKAVLHAIRAGAHWQGDPAELDQLLVDLKAAKRAEAKAQLERAHGNGRSSDLGH